MDQSMLIELKNELKKAVRQHYAVLKERYPGEDFYGYSLHTGDLYTCAEFPHLSPVANNVSFLTRDKADSEYNYYKYNPDEWDHWDDFGMFDQVNQIIEKSHVAVDLEDKVSATDCDDSLVCYFSDNMVHLKEGILDKALEALYELMSEGLFGSECDNRFLVVWVSDSDDEIMNISAEKLNSRGSMMSLPLNFLKFKFSSEDIRNIPNLPLILLD